jgi:hypothetical protein
MSTLLEGMGNMKKKAQAVSVQLPPPDQWSGIAEALKPLDLLAREMELK